MDRYKFYDVFEVEDPRKLRPTQFAVMAHNGLRFTADAMGGLMVELKDFNLLYQTDRIAEDGGIAQCRAWIEGHVAGLPPRPVTSVGSMSDD